MQPPADYDNQGQARLPWLFWGVLILQARTWVVFLIAGASRGQGEGLLNLFYPDRQNFWLGLLPGVPAVLAFLLSGRRHVFPTLWRAWRWVLIVAQVGLFAWQLVQFVGGDPGLSGVLLALADLYAVWWLVASRRLRLCF